MDDFEIRITRSGSSKRYTEIFPEMEGSTFMEYILDNAGILRYMTVRGHGNRYIVHTFNGSNGELHNMRMSLSLKGFARFFDITYNTTYKLIKYIDIQKNICHFQSEFL